MASMVQWNKFDLRVINEESSLVKGTVKSHVLHNTNLGCTTFSEAGQWENRQIFMERVVADINANCPKDEPLAVVSLGTARPLVEYILGKTLIENGFRQISFFLIDPIYKFCPKEQVPFFDKAIKDFQKKIGAAYFDRGRIPKKWVARQHHKILHDKPSF